MCINLFPPCLFETKDKSDLGNFFDAIQQHSRKNKCGTKRDQLWNRFKNIGVCMCDLMAPLVLLYPELITNMENKPVSVELNGQYTRSMMVVDRNNQVLPNKSTTCLVIEIDVEKATQLKEMKFY